MQRYSGMVNYKNIPAFFKILPDLLRIPDIIRNFVGYYEKDRSCQGTDTGIQGTGSGISNTKEASITASLFSYL